MEEVNEEWDVILENSPLHQHLTDAGLNVEVEQKIKSKEATLWCNINSTEGLWLEDLVTDKFHFYLAKWKTSYSQVTTSFYIKMLDLALSSCVVLNEDKNLVESYRDNALQQRSTLPQAGLWLHSLLLSCLLAAVSSFLIKHSTHWFSFVALCVLSCGSLVYAVHCLMLQRHKYSLQKQLCHFIKLIKTVENLSTVFRKSLQFIQETELTTQGYLLINKHPVFEQYISGKRQCCNLRKYVFHTARKCVLQMRNSTKNLLLVYPISTDINLLCGIPLSEYGPSMTDEDESSLKISTDDFSLPSLKAIVQLCSIHCSEFICRFILCFGPGVDLDVHKHLINEYLIKTLRSCETEIQEQYRYNRFSLKSDYQNKHDSVSPRIQSKCYSALHSTSMHLQVALNSTWDLEQKCNSEINHVDKDEWEIVKTRIKAALECWDELQVPDINKDDSMAVCTDKDVEDIIKECNDPEPMNSNLQPQQEEDEVYECDTFSPDSEFVQDLTDTSETELISKEETLKLMSELKTVITLRAAQKRKLTHTEQSDTNLEMERNTSQEVSIVNQVDNIVSGIVDTNKRDIAVNHQKENLYAELESLKLTQMEQQHQRDGSRTVEKNYQRQNLISFNEYTRCTANLAAMIATKSVSMNVDTFGDSEDES